MTAPEKTACPLIFPYAVKAKSALISALCRLRRRKRFRISKSEGGCFYIIIKAQKRRFFNIM
ncbi:MAG TPA: hypothetical protein DD628_07350 [Clostridiales bacterium]|nr:hypothetical protein [Candidatus Apopatosoma intestinale]